MNQENTIALHKRAVMSTQHVNELVDNIEKDMEKRERRLLEVQQLLEEHSGFTDEKVLSEKITKINGMTEFLTRQKKIREEHLAKECVVDQTSHVYTNKKAIHDLWEDRASFSV